MSSVLIKTEDITEDENKRVCLNKKILIKIKLSIRKPGPEKETRQRKRNDP